MSKISRKTTYYMINKLLSRLTKHRDQGEVNHASLNLYHDRAMTLQRQLKDWCVGCQKPYDGTDLFCDPCKERLDGMNKKEKEGD